MTDQRDYTELARECERRAAAGEKPLGEWLFYDEEYHLQLVDYTASVTVTPACVTIGDTDRGCFALTACGLPADTKTLPTFQSGTAAQLFAEALLRDATRPLHREAYEERDRLRAENERLTGEVSRGREMLDGMNADFHHLQANADTIAHTLNQVRAENERLRLFTDTLQTDSDLMSEAIENLKRENERLRAALREIVEGAPATAPDAESAREGQNHDDIYSVGYDCAMFDCSVIAATALKEPADA